MKFIFDRFRSLKNSGRFVTPGFSFQNFDLKNVQNSLNDLSLSSSAGILGILAKVLKTLPEIFCPIFQHLFNKCLESKMIPNDWKLAVVTPLFKNKGEKTDKNNSYKERFSNLEKVLLIKFAKDTMIIPKETAWFQFYDENKKVADLTESDFYKEDFIGVKKLNEEKKIEFLTFDGNHLHFTKDEIEKYMIPSLS